MTTIAYRDGVLATDKQGSDGGTICTAKIKASVIGPKVYAITGTVTRGLKFIHWLHADQESEAPSLKKTVVVEMDLNTGKCQVWETDFPMPLEDRFYAWGSGKEIAIGAMEWGANADDAIKCAAKWDEATGKGVQVFASIKA